MTKPPSIRDIAERAHVSVATVSRVINAQAGVDGRTRDLVWQAIRELEYDVVRHPDALAGILVVAPMVSFQNRQWRLAMSGILDEASRLSIPVIFSTALNKAEVQAQVRCFSSRAGVHGIILACFPMSLGVQQWLPDDPNIVSAAILMQGARHQINIDTYTAFRDATRQLLALGHRRIAMTVSASAYWVQYQALQGYLDAHAEAGIPQPEVAHIGLIAKAADWLKQRLTETDRPTAIMGGTSGLSNYLFSAILDLRLRLPGDLSFVGVGHSGPFETPYYDTIAQPTFEVGVEAVRTLRQIVARPGSLGLNINLPAQRITVGTVAAP